MEGGPFQLRLSEEYKDCGALVPVKNVLKRDRGQGDKAVALERKVFPTLSLLHSVQISLIWL